MKIIKRVLGIIVILVIVVFAFRGWLYRHLVTYRSVGLRASYAVRSQELRAYIEAGNEKQTNLDVKQVIKLALSITAKQLNFTTGKNNNNPNKLIKSKTAHCVGYAAFFAATCNYLLQKHNLKNSWTAKPQIGKLYFLGANVHAYIHSPFFSDHDFVTIENTRTGEILAIDPTLNDYLNICFVTYKQ